MEMWLGVVALSEAILRWVELRSLLLHSSGEGLSETGVNEFELKSRVRLGGPIAIVAWDRVVVLFGWENAKSSSRSITGHET